jgi:hypothetical protein
MVFYKTVTGEDVVHIGFDPMVGKEVYRLDETLIYTDNGGMIGGYPFIQRSEGYAIILFLSGTWRKVTSKDELQSLTNPANERKIFAIQFVEEEA